MSIPTKSMTVEDFDKWVFLPENTDKSFEYIGEEIVEVVSNNYSSLIAGEVLYHIKHFLKVNKIKGYITGADGGYVVAGERYIPDVGYISGKRQSKSCREAYNPNYPDLAVEVVSPSDSERDVTLKVVNYLSVGTVVWVIYPEKKEVNVIEPGQAAKKLSENDIIDGGTVLPNFKLKVSEIFPDD